MQETGEQSQERQYDYSQSKGLLIRREDYRPEYIHISSIPSSTSKATLLSIFSEYSIKSCYYPTHLNPFYSYSYAILSFPSNEIPQILSKLNYTRINNVSIFLTKYLDVLQWNSTLHYNNLYITQLPSSLTQAQFRKDYEQFGQVLNTRIIESSIGASLQCGFVKFKDSLGCLAAKQQSASVFNDGRVVNDYQAKPEEMFLMSLSPFYWKLSVFWNDFDFTEYLSYGNEKEEEEEECQEMSIVGSGNDSLNSIGCVGVMKHEVKFRAFILSEKERLLKKYQETTVYIKMINKTSVPKNKLKDMYWKKLSQWNLKPVYLKIIIKTPKDKSLYYHYTIISFIYKDHALAAMSALSPFNPVTYEIKKELIKHRMAFNESLQYQSETLNSPGAYYIL